MMKLDKKIIIGGIVAAILLSLALGYVLFGRNLFSLKDFVSQTQTKKQPEDKPLTVTLKAVQDGGGQKLEIYLSAKKPVDLAAFQFRASLPPSISDDDLSLTTNLELKQQAWTFPIARIEAGEVKLAGFRLGNSPYQIGHELLFATLTTGSKTPLSLTINHDDSIFYAADATTQIPFNVITK